MASEDRQFWTEFLELYKELPSLWKIKSAEYSNRIIKNQCYEKLVEKLKYKYPNANREMVVKKINNFRTSYRKELKKIKLSDKSGAGTEDIYEPNLWYFPILSFLEDQEDCLPGRSTMDTDEEVSPRRKKKKISDEENLIKIACEQLQAERQAINSEASGDDILAKGWAAEMKKMEPRQRLMAIKLISDVIFHGCMGNLETFHTIEVPKVLQQKSRPVSTTSIYSTTSPIPLFTENSSGIPNSYTSQSQSQPQPQSSNSMQQIEQSFNEPTIQQYFESFSGTKY